MLPLPPREQLLERLDATIELLRRWGGAQWTEWMQTARADIAEGNPAGVAHLLGAYGGMGSFNDWAIGVPLDDARRAQVEGANEELGRLRDEMWVIADTMRDR